MLRASPPLSVGQASHYYRSEFSRGDYYTERQSEGIVASRWHGRGASELGLSGRVKAEDFARLLEGRDPSGRSVLVAHREGKDERRAGWDVTISPHKSVSLQALVGGDSRLLDAHDRAVSKAVAELERHAQAWIRGGRDVETTGLVIAGSFRHETSRALDPQLHSHCVLLNITRRSDGEWRAVDARGIFRAQRLAREIYESELRKELVSLGYAVTSYRDGRHGRDRAVGIAGFRDEHLKHFSKRSREIEKALQAGGLKSRLHGSRVTVATRAVKAKGIDREALLWNWRTTAREMAIEFPRADKARAVLDRHLGIGPDVELAARAAVNGAVSHLSERRTVFRVADLERDALASMRDKGVTIDDVRNEIATRADLVLVDQKDAVVARVTTTQAIDHEHALVDAVERARGRGAVIPSKGDGRGLGEDQIKVARHVLESPDRLVAVEGKAGTGKSTTLAHVRERAEEAGFRVRGFAPTTTAAGVLRDGGIDSTTVAALLKETPAGTHPGRELWIVDEAGLLSTKQARELLDRAEQAGAKLVLVGDRAQHRAVEAGSPFEVLIERGKVATERLDVIRRQRDEQLRDVVRAASERGGARLAVQLLEERGRVTEIVDPRLRHERITRDFVADGGRGVVIAPSNAERIDLNRRIREALIESGQVERKSVKAKVVVKQDLTAEQKRRVSSFSDGDVLRFVRSGDGIAAGERGRVVGIDERKNRLWLELEESGRVRVINPKERRAFEVERVQEKRFAVGDRIQFRARDRSLDVANGTVGTIRKLDHARGIATVDVGGRRFRMDLSEPRAVDHAYAVTSHRSQGLSKERVYLAVDTRHSEELVNRRQFYVGVSRAVEDARVYTDDRSALARAVSREQGRESALQIADRAPAPESRTAVLRRETALDLVRSGDERRGREDDRAAGSDRRSQDAGRGRVAPGRGAEGAAGPARGTAGAERSRAAGADRVPGPGDAGAARTGRAAGLEAERGLGPARAVPGRAGAADARAVGGPGVAASPSDGPARVLADGADDRGSNGGRLPGRAGRDVPPEHESESGHDRGIGRAEGQTVAQPQARALSKEEIAKSPELRRLYAKEYASMLRMYPDRELAREAARVNVSALASGQPRIVPGEGRIAADHLRGVLGRGDDLAVIRRAVTRAIERAAPAIERLPRALDLGRER
jgi:conjugative relaxase-like TrwC/TraI family protein